MKITEFKDEYRFLSNFYWAPIIDEREGILYPTVEHAYQAYKTDDLSVRKEIANTMLAGQAKNLGQLIPLPDDWDQQKVKVISKWLKKKFEIPSLRYLLIATGDATLIEGNHWGDTFWGVCNDVGENMLGRMLMQLRHNLINDYIPR